MYKGVKEYKQQQLNESQNKEDVRFNKYKNNDKYILLSSFSS